MNHRLIASSLASLLAVAGATSAHAADSAKEKEKCFGVAKAGTNDCANLSGSHSCAGQSKNERAVEDFNYVPKGTCLTMGGKFEDDAKAELAKK